MMISLFMVTNCRFTTTPLVIMLMAALMVVVPKSGAQSSSPLCVSQFALANHACAFIPSESELGGTGDDDDNDDDDNDNDNDQGDHGHRQQNSSSHHHHHHHQSQRSQDPSRECCRWLKAIDARCVCDLLVRLPVFLSRPVHSYRVKVHHGCKINFKCPGRLILGR